MCVCVCDCVLYLKKKIGKKKNSHFGREKKIVRKQNNIIACFDWSTSESVSPCRRPLDWHLSRSALARIPRARPRSRTSAVFCRPAGQQTKSASTSYHVRVFASMQRRIRLD